MRHLKTWLAGLMVAALPALASAQSNPHLAQGQVLTPAQWNNLFAGKQDVLGYLPMNAAGGTFTGRVITAPPGASTAGLNLTPGTTPGSPANGDVWITSAGLFARVNGITVGPVAGPSSASFAGTAPISVSFPGGVTTYAINNGTSVANPGTGTLEALLPIQTVTGASKAFATVDLFKETRRSNSGSAMTDTFPASSATGLVNGTKITIVNVDATANDTITAGAGTTISGTGIVGPGRAIQYVYDLPNTIWRPTLNTGTALLGPNNLSEITSASTARTNLGLGTAAVQNIGTSGANVPLLNGANTWSATQTMSGLAVAGTFSVNNVLVPNATGSYQALNNAAVAKNLLLVSDTAVAADTTRLRSAGGAVTVEKSNGDAIAAFMETGEVGIGTTAPATVFSGYTAAVINGTNGGTLDFSAGGATKARFTSDDTKFYISAAKIISFGTGASGVLADTGTERALLSDTGLFTIKSPGAIEEIANPAPNRLLVMEGNSSTPVTTDNNTMVISRREAVSGFPTHNEALKVISIGNNDNLGVPSNAAQTTAFTAEAWQLGTGDVAAVQGSARNIGTGQYVAFGAFFNADTTNPNGGAVGIGLNVSNQSGVNRAYNPAAIPLFAGLDIPYTSDAVNRDGEVGVYLRNTGTSAGKWDTGIAFAPSSIRTTSIRDDSNAVTIFLGNGSHTNGIDLSAGTFSGNPIMSNGFSVDASGAVRSAASQGYFLGTIPIVNLNSGYHTIYDPASNVSISIGSSDPATYIDNTTVKFRSRGGGVSTFATLDSSGLALTVALSAINGGTGQSTYALGDTLYSSAANTLSKLAGNTTSTKKFLRQTGTGSVSAAPAWDTVVAADIPGSALTKTDDTNVTLTLGGSPTTALLNAASITVGWTGTLAASRGGTGISSLGTGVATAFGINVGSAGAFVTFNGALGTPSSGTLTNATGLPTTGLTGTLQAAQEPAHTGDVTNSAGSLALTIANNAVTLAKLATQATNTVLANATSGTAVPTALAVSSCDTATKALQWTTNTGFACNSSITAAAVPANGLTGTTLSASVVTSSLTSLGTITTLTATTINAFTLAGTISGGGNQINNIVIGNTTPLAGSFTTLIGTGGTHTGITSLGIRDTSAAFDVTLAATSTSATLSAGRTLTLDMGNVAHTVKFGTTANTITFPNLASYTVITNADTATVTNAMLSTMATNTIKGNATSGSASPINLTIPSCSTAASALIWTTNTGFGCNTVSATAASMTVGTTTVLSGTTTRVLYDNGGVLGEYTISGSGSVAMTASPTFSGATTFPGSTTVDSSGYLGVGTSSISTLFANYTPVNISGSSGASINLLSGSTSQARIIADTNNLYIAATGAGISFGFGASGTGTEAARFSSAGLILTVLSSDTATTDTTLCARTSDNLVLKGTGALGICLGTSGRQFKTAFAPMTAGIDDLMKINIAQNYRYQKGFGDSGARLQYGPTAQDVEAALPDLVRYDAKGDAINYDSGALLFVGLRSIQQLKAANDNFEERLAKLESRR